MDWLPLWKKVTLHLSHFTVQHFTLFWSKTIKHANSSVFCWPYSCGHRWQQTLCSAMARGGWGWGGLMLYVSWSPPTDPLRPPSGLSCQTQASSSSGHKGLNSSRSFFGFGAIPQLLLLFHCCALLILRSCLKVTVSASEWESPVVCGRRRRS